MRRRRARALLAMLAAAAALAPARTRGDEHASDPELLALAKRANVARQPLFEEAVAHTEGRAVRVMHVPKCGSSFQIAAWHYACPGTPLNMTVPRHGAMFVPKKFYPAKDFCPEASDKARIHAPYRSEDETDFVDGRFTPWLTMLRDPSQRFISGFHAGLHSYGMSRHDREHMRSTVTTPAQYARYPGIAGCMTKMLIGKNCASSHHVTSDDVTLAKRVLAERIAFFGITDRWQDSLDLFHAMTFTQCDRASTEGRNVRPGQQSSARDAFMGYNTSVLEGFVDEADESLYAFAVSLFEARRHRYRHALSC